NANRIRLCRPGSPRQVLGGGTALQGARPAARIRDLASGAESVECARGGMEFCERDCRSGWPWTEDLLSTNGHAEAGEEPPSSGPEREWRACRSYRSPKSSGQQGSRPPPATRSEQAEGLGRAVIVERGTW